MVYLQILCNLILIFAVFEPSKINCALIYNKSDTPIKGLRDLIQPEMMIIAVILMVSYGVLVLGRLRDDALSGYTSSL
ncbi:hypothetical protein [Microcystis aeruginosa]|jgi:hypothetical protein|uniref:Uncharacterized protein n=1 Tax=Microcystis aeruginosa Ma_QC_C_20070703_M131 TaxID=2486263 RepID=A0A551X3A4_MICAE|nr:hypothetical protein [Microcystis aeruginosa]MDB9392172.1 hypothetical protein [Microcystis aeruginosa CS-579]TRT43241.1 MAG: hypothetical protein EWV85_22605 [Microcystis aeruginosa Ma_QC_C_20070703_M131]